MDPEPRSDCVTPVLPVVNLLVSGAMLLFTYYVAVLSAVDRSSDLPVFQWALLPTIMLAVAAGVFALVGLVFSPGRLKALVASSIALGMLWLPALFGLFGATGGLEGGLAVMFVVIGTIPCFVVAGFTLVVATRMTRGRKQGP